MLKPHLKPSTPPDLIHDMIVCYYEAKAETPKNVSYTVNTKIRELKKKNNQEYGMRFKTISLDQCYYDSGKPLIEFFAPDNYL